MIATYLTNHTNQRMILALLETEGRIRTLYLSRRLYRASMRGFLRSDQCLNVMGWTFRPRKRAWAFCREVCLGSPNLHVPPRLYEIRTSLGGLSRRATMSEQQGQCAHQGPCAPVNRAKIKQLLSDQWVALDALDSALFELRTTIQILEIVSGHLDPKERISNAIIVLNSDWSNEFDIYTNKLEQVFEKTRELKELVA